MYKNLNSEKQAYFEQIWSFVQDVPYGKVVTYGQIAKALPAPECLELDDSDATGARLVGSAMATCPSNVPWHRVVNGQGKVSNRGGADKQYQLLESKGLCFFQGKLDLDEYQWF